MQRRQLFQVGAAAALLGASSMLSVRAQSLPSFRFNLGWRVEASAAGFLLAQQRGYYKDAGVDVQIDIGNGSAAAINFVASGTYEAASADLSAMIEFNQKFPERRLSAVAIQYDLNPNAILVRRDSGIVKPADLAGKTILGQPFNASRKLFPVFAQANGFDPNSVQWASMDPGVGDTRFAKGDFDAAAYFFFTGLLNMKSRGVMPDQLRVFRFSEHGMRSYGNGLVTSAKVMQESPDALRAFVKGSTRGWIEAIANPAAAVAAMKAREPLLNEPLELERMQLIASGTMVTPATRSHGWGMGTQARLQATIDETTAAFGLKPGSTVAEMWSDRFLPPAAERMLKA
jgi:NitT/TauT family transport system substrate-binding protein